MSVAVDLAGTAATESLGRRLAGGLPPDTRGWLLLLQGELGAGKSTLARALVHALGHQGPVPSPTYTLVEPYDVAGRRIYHVDLYRLSGESELPYLGWADMDDGLMLVEWPERVPTLATQADVSIRLNYQGAARHAELTAASRRGSDLLRTVFS